MLSLFTRKRHSYGVIPLRLTEYGVEVLLINQIDNHTNANEYWTFPKGTPEKGESPQETAIRETKEETGIECSRVEHDFAYDDHYTFRDGLITIDKTVTYYIGLVQEGKVTLQQSEVRDYAWCTLEEARVKLTNDNARAVIDAIEKHLPQSRLFDAKSV